MDISLSILPFPWWDTDSYTCPNWLLLLSEYLKKPHMRCSKESSQCVCLCQAYLEPFGLMLTNNAVLGKWNHVKFLSHSVSAHCNFWNSLFFLVIYEGACTTLNSAVWNVKIWLIFNVHLQSLGRSQWKKNRNRQFFWLVCFASRIMEKLFAWFSWNIMEGYSMGRIH